MAARLAVVALLAAAAAGCGAGGRPGGAAQPTTDRSITASSPAPPAGDDGRSASPPASTAASGSATATGRSIRTPGPITGSSELPVCDYTERVRCTDAAGIRHWWPRGAVLEAQASIEHTYAMFSPKGFGPGVTASDDGSRLILVLHPRGGSPRELAYGRLVSAGAILVQGIPSRQRRALPSEGGQPVTVQDEPGFLAHGNHDRAGRPTTRILVWSQRVGDTYVNWSVDTSLRVWTSDDDVLRIVNGMRRS